MSASPPGQERVSHTENTWLGLRLATKNVSWQTDGGEADDGVSFARLDLTNEFKKSYPFSSVVKINTNLCRGIGANMYWTHITV